MMECACERVIVADRGFPVFDDPDLVEEAAANRGAAPPAEVLALLGEHGGYRCVPGSQERRWQIAAIGDEPAHRRGRADSGIGERGNQALEPGFPRATVGVGECEEFEVRWELLDNGAQGV